MTKRIWNLRLNLDEWNAAVGGLFTSEERSLFLQGFTLGCNGGALPEQCSNSARTGFEQGLKARNEAEEFKKAKSDAGSRSAESRKEKFGSAQPSKSAVAPPNDDRTAIEQCSGNPRTSLEPILNPQSNIKEVPPKPPKGGTRVRRPRTPKELQPSLLDQIPAENLIHAVNQIINLTPMTDLSGRPIRVVAAELLERVQARLSEHPSATPAIMVEAWADYLATNPQCLKAPQYFFGKKEDQKGGELSANWYDYAKAIFVRNHKKQQEG